MNRPFLFISIFILLITSCSSNNNRVSWQSFDNSLKYFSELTQKYTCNAIREDKTCIRYYEEHETGTTTTNGSAVFKPTITYVDWYCAESSGINNYDYMIRPFVIAKDELTYYYHFLQEKMDSYEFYISPLKIAISITKNEDDAYVCYYKTKRKWIFTFDSNQHLCKCFYSEDMIRYYWDNTIYYSHYKTINVDYSYS